MQSPVSLAKDRPTETATPVVVAVAVLLAKLIGVDDPDTIFYMTIVLAFVPAAVTWLVVLLRKRSEV